MLLKKKIIPCMFIPVTIMIVFITMDPYCIFYTWGRCEKEVFLSWDTFKPFRPNQTGNYPISSNPNKEGMGPSNCLLDIQATHPFSLSGRC